MLEPIFGGGGFLFGLAFRWWALVVPGGVGVWAGLTSELEVSSWWIGLAVGGLTTVGVVLGGMTRSRLARL